MGFSVLIPENRSFVIIYDKVADGGFQVETLIHGSSGNNLIISKYLLFCSKTFAYFGNKRY
jgi:hypothetical protein